MAVGTEAAAVEYALWVSFEGRQRRNDSEIEQKLFGARGLQIVIVSQSYLPVFPVTHCCLWGAQMPVC